MKFLLVLCVLLLGIQDENPKLNQDIIYPKATEVKIGNGESCEVISKKNMMKARSILLEYWNQNQPDSMWSKFNRQYMTYKSLRMGTVVYINGACLEKPADFFQKTWCLGMAKDKCYFLAFVDLKKKQVVSFEWNTYDK